MAPYAFRRNEGKNKWGHGRGIDRRSKDADVGRVH
jgi:hypothetical protein